MVDKFKIILNKLNAQGHVSLFVVLRMDDFVDKWSIVLCADWAKPRDDESFNKVINIIKEELTMEESNTIARIGIFKEDEYIPLLFFPYKKGHEFKEKTQINGFVVYEGYVLESEQNMLLDLTKQ